MDNYLGTNKISFDNGITFEDLIDINNEKVTYIEDNWNFILSKLSKYSKALLEKDFNIDTSGTVGKLLYLSTYLCYTKNNLIVGET